MEAIEPPFAFTDPSGVLLGLAALVAIIAATQWLAFAGDAGRLLASDGRKVRRSLRLAAIFTGTALGLAGVGYLLKIF